MRVEKPAQEPGEVIRQLRVALAELLEQDVDVALVHAEVGHEGGGVIGFRRR